MTRRVAIVTGGAGGIGRACAAALAGRGHLVVVTDRDLDAAAAVAGEIGGDAVAADLAGRAGCRRLVDEVLARHGGVGILLNIAGFQHIDPIDEFPEDAWDRMIAVMLTAPFLLTRYCWPAMRAASWGRVVNMASIHSLVASPFKAGYVSAKHGLIGLTRVAALEGGPYGITVNAVSPAYVRTPLVEGQIADQARTRGVSTQEVVDEVMLARAAVKRLVEPAEVAEVVAFLCSEEAGAITGANWTVDTGWTAG